MSAAGNYTDRDERLQVYRWQILGRCGTAVFIDDSMICAMRTAVALVMNGLIGREIRQFLLNRKMNIHTCFASDKPPLHVTVVLTKIPALFLATP